jgi:hypothetical protein
MFTVVKNHNMLLHELAFSINTRWLAHCHTVELHAPGACMMLYYDTMMFVDSVQCMPLAACQ